MWHEFLFLLGLWPYPQGTPWTYQLWSGFIPALTVLSLLGGAIAHLRSLNCSVARCPRVGRYQVDGHKVCWKHHPSEHITRKGVTHEHIISLHAAEAQRNETRG